jgi:hypothetical protein
LPTSALSSLFNVFIRLFAGLFEGFDHPGTLQITQRGRPSYTVTTASHAVPSFLIGSTPFLEGEAEISIAGNPQRLHCGEMILMPAGQPHALKALARFKMILTMIRSQT